MGKRKLPEDVGENGYSFIFFWTRFSYIALLSFLLRLKIWKLVFSMCLDLTKKNHFVLVLFELLCIFCNVHVLQQFVFRLLFRNLQCSYKANS